ncbi:MAG TPA: TldD/PmbA family protein [Kofleriaceae bacterium]|nr:TldD/PmbA family protein [Kofleriaceae bacterium]
MTRAPESYREAAEAALAALRGVPGVDFADVRVSREERRVVSLRNHEVDEMAEVASAGIGVRVLRDGAWGFAARPATDAAAGAAAARRAAEIAGGVARAQTQRVRMAEEEPARGTYATRVAVDPFAVPVEQVLADLEAAVEVMRPRARPGAIQSASAAARYWRQRKLYLNTDGADTWQDVVFGGAGLKVTASGDDCGAVQRTWPMDFDGGLVAAGYETVAALELAENAARIREECLALVTAPPCPAGATTLLLDTPQLALQIHESCGHPTEADRAMGEEISLAGASFLTPDKLGRFTYGSPLVNLTADSRAAGGLGTFGWDDEGVPARVTPLVARGIFVGYLSSRETAAELGLGRSAGCMRAESWAVPAIIRMINVSLEPDPKGPASLEELIADTDDGVLMTQNQSWSIDDLRLNFQFGCEAAWEVKRGKRTRLLRNPIYTGSTPAFWRGCDAVGGPAAWKLWGLASCGKGDPIQGMAVGHGCAPSRFRNVQVGSSRP